MPPLYTVTLNPGLDRTLTVPKLYENNVLRASASRLDWGGKGFNVTRALQAMGVKSVAMGLVGGFTGQMLTQGLNQLGIATDFVHIDGESRTNTVIEEAESGRYIKVNELGPQIEAAALEALRARILAQLTPGSYWALCGSLPPGTPSNFYADLIARIQSHGAFACLDASGAALRLGTKAVPFLVKPNAEEAAEYTGIAITTITDAQRAALAFLDHGVTLVALSLGADGLLLAQNEQVLHARPPQVVAQTPVGVGDALLAGLLYALRRKMPLPEVARWGVAAGSAAAMRPGVGVGKLEEIIALAQQVTIAILPPL
jgi:1-phosphofructokinase